MIKLKDDLLISQVKEMHYKLDINGKEIWVNRWSKWDELDTDGDTEIFKGKELLSEEEQEEVIDFVNDLD